MEAVIETTDLTKVYPGMDRPAVDKLNLTIERGEIRGLPPDIEVVHAPLGAATPLLPTR